MKIYSALYQDSAHLEKFGTPVTVHSEHQMDGPGILILHGGSDISPSIYNKTPNEFTGASKQLSERDLIEIRLAKSAIKAGIPIFGICRGAQLACALAGGSLVQHISGHYTGFHPVVTNKGERYQSSTCHHQMMNLENTEHELLAWAAPSLSKFYLGEPNEHLELEVEPEVVYFPTIKALAVQGHPEWMPSSSNFVQYCLQLVEEKLHAVL